MPYKSEILVIILFGIDTMKKTPLYDIHSERGAVFDDFSGWLMPRDYGNRVEECLAVRYGVGIVDLSHRGKLRLSGKEHIRFLHGMLTNDINRLEVGKGLYATLLTPKGRMLSDMRVYRESESVLLDLEPGLNERVGELLIRFRLSYKADIEDVTEGLALLFIHGPNSRGVLERAFNESILLPNEYDFSVVEVNGFRVVVARVNRTGEEGYDVFVPSDGVKTVWRSVIEGGKGFQIRPVGLDAMETLRIEAGIPRYGVDMDEDTIPLEAGLWHAVSFEKGCYVGQEVIARIRWRGHVNWHLVGFEIEGEGLPESGDRVFHGEREIGHITSSALSPTLKRVIALGYIRREFMEPGTGVIIKTNDKSRSAEVVRMPFIRRGLPEAS
jgi:glycine cleavage system T protein